MKKIRYVAVAGSLAISLGMGNSIQAADGPGGRPAVDVRSAPMAASVQYANGVIATPVGSAGAASTTTVSATPQIPQAPTTPPPIGSPAGLAPQAGGGALAPDVAPAGAGFAPPAPAPQKSIWGFFGMPQTFDAMGTKCSAKKAACKAELQKLPLVQAMCAMLDPMAALLGLKPGLAPIGSPEALKAAANPALKKSEAVQTANAVKQEEDAAPAKIQAIKYLATVDCKCYPGVKSALLQALKDCTEEVRFEAAKALGSACCCDADVAKKLEEVATKQDDFGNYKEWSRRVREAAAQSMQACSGLIQETPSKQFPPEVKPEVAPPLRGEVPPLPTQTNLPKARPVEAVLTTSADQDEYPVILRGLSGRLGGNPTNEQRIVATPRIAMPTVDKESPELIAPPAQPTDMSGTISFVDSKSGSVQVTFPNGAQLKAGSHVKVYHKYLLRRAYLGELEIVDATDGNSIARPTGELTIRRLNKGDQVVVQE